MSALNVAPLPATCSEQELISAVRRGSDRAFEELYCRYRARISSYIFGMVGDHARAEDLLQEVFISALRRLRKTERPIAFKPWIYEIAKNACIDEFRRARRAREVPLDDDDDGDEEDRRLLSSALTPDLAVERKQSLTDLQGAFGGLSESHHKIIVMRELEGLSYSQIGERLGMSRPVVESTLFRARRRLTEEYNELISGRRCHQVQALIAETEPRLLLKLGVRQRRQLARHLAHCQPCRRHARLAGVDESLFQAPSLGRKIAALLPIPWLRRFANNHLSRVSEVVGAAPGLSRAGAVIAAAALAGAGGGIVSAAAEHENPAAPAPAAALPVSHPVLPHTVKRRHLHAALVRHPARAHKASKPHRRQAGVSGSKWNSIRAKGVWIVPRGSGGHATSSGSGSTGISQPPSEAPASKSGGSLLSRVPVLSKTGGSSPSVSLPPAPKVSLPQLPKLSDVQATALPKVSLTDPTKALGH